MLLCSQALISAVITMETVPSCASPPPRPPEPVCALLDIACAEGNSLARVGYSHTPAAFCMSTQIWLEEIEENVQKLIQHKIFSSGGLFRFAVGVGSFLLYSVHEGIRGIPLDPSDKSDALVPVSGTSLAVGIDFHAGKPPHVQQMAPIKIACKYFVSLMLPKVFV